LKRKDPIELQRQRISIMLRAQASIVRAEFLNQVLPAALEAFDNAVARGEAIDIEPVSIDRMIEMAVAEVTV
jgi:hypothetical protein